MDYTQTTPGREAQLTHYTLDRHRYPNDPRGLTFVKQQGEHGLTSPQIVYLQGRRFMFVGGMFASNFITIFRWDGEIAVPSGVIMQWGGPLYRTSLTWPPNRPSGTFIWRDENGDGNFQASEFKPNTSLVRPGPFWVDSAGDIWMANLGDGPFFRYRFMGLDEVGNPIYTASDVVTMPTPPGMSRVRRVWYDRASDTLVAADQGSNNRRIGEIFVYRRYLGTNPAAPSVRFRSGAGTEASSLAVAGDYIFTVGFQTRGRVWINRLHDGAAVGVLTPGPEVGGPDATGWVDLLTGVSAHRRTDGEYLVFVEENYRAKNLLYRWRP